MVTEKIYKYRYLKVYCILYMYNEITHHCGTQYTTATTVKTNETDKLIIHVYKYIFKHRVPIYWKKQLF